MYVSFFYTLLKISKGILKNVFFLSNSPCKSSDEKVKS